MFIAFLEKCMSFVETLFYSTIMGEWFCETCLINLSQRKWILGSFAIMSVINDTIFNIPPFKYIFHVDSIAC